MQDNMLEKAVGDGLDPEPLEIDMAQSGAAIVATTRRLWLAPQDRGSERYDGGAKRLALVDPLVRYALDAKRADAWRARIDRIRRIAQVRGGEEPPHGGFPAFPDSAHRGDTERPEFPMPDPVRG